MQMVAEEEKGCYGETFGTALLLIVVEWTGNFARIKTLSLGFDRVA